MQCQFFIKLCNYLIVWMLLKHRTGQGQWKSVDDNSLNKDQLTTKQNAHLDPQMDMN